MRSNYEIKIRRDDGSINTIPMHSTTYQATKAMRALSYALNDSGVDRLSLWLCTKMGRVLHSSIGYESVKKAG